MLCFESITLQLVVVTLQVVKALQKLPTDTVVGEQELQQLSTAELKERLQQVCGQSHCLHLVTAGMIQNSVHQAAA